MALKRKGTVNRTSMTSGNVKLQMKNWPIAVSIVHPGYSHCPAFNFWMFWLNVWGLYITLTIHYTYVMCYAFTLTLNLVSPHWHSVSVPISEPFATPVNYTNDKANIIQQVKQNQNKRNDVNCTMNSQAQINYISYQTVFEQSLHHRQTQTQLTKWFYIQLASSESQTVSRRAILPCPFSFT